MKEENERRKYKWKKRKCERDGYKEKKGKKVGNKGDIAAKNKRIKIK